MKVLVSIARVIVGALFIFSGFIKLNDPLGFSYKLQEYFGADVLGLEFLIPYALPLAVFLVIFEVVLGVMLLLGYKVKFTMWSLLLMILFFTFLTFYSAYFEKVTDCGCFGDAIPLTPWESFWKDVILLVLILFLFWKRELIKPIFGKMPTTILTYVSVILCAWFGYHVLMHLPSLDFRPYKEGVNITEGMIIPEDAPKPIFEYNWKFNVNGKEEIHKTSGEYPTVDGELLGVETKMIDEGYEPPIHDFSIEKDEKDHTKKFLTTENLVMVVAYNLSKSEDEGIGAMKAATDQALRNGYKVIGLSASGPEDIANFKKDHKLNFDFYFCDETALKTIVRSNPGVLKLNKGTILQKLHWNDLDELQLETLDNAIPNLNFELKKQLDSVYALDQKYRELYMQAKTNEERDSLWGLQRKADVSNLAFIEEVIKEHGYPGKSIVGEPTNKAAWYVIQHSDKIPEYIDLMKAAGTKDELPFRLVAMMEDRYLMSKDQEQLYGTQGMTYFIDGEDVSFMWPIKDHENVNQRRKEAGFEEDIEAYSKGLGIEYKPITLEEALVIRQKMRDSRKKQ